MQNMNSTSVLQMYMIIKYKRFKNLKFKNSPSPLWPFNKAANYKTEKQFGFAVHKNSGFDVSFNFIM